MHRGHHNLSLHWTRRPSLFHRALTLGLLISLVMPIPRAEAAASKGQLMQNGAFLGLASVIYQLNNAMRSMADSPLEKPRRDAVNQAMAALPGAIQGLAGEFQSSKLGNSSLPIVFSMLGGFVDERAADNYNKFLQNPSRDLIPKWGSDFPVEAARAQNTSLFYQSPSSAQPTAAPVAMNEASAKVPSGDQIVNLSSASGLRGLVPSAGQSGLFYNRDLPAGAPVEKTAVSNGSRPSALSTTQKDLEQIENGVRGLTILNRVNRETASEEKTELEASEMFKSVGKDQKPTPETIKRPNKPLSWRGIPVLPLIGLASLSIEARAENPQQESGSKAAEILFGMAAIIGAIVPIFVASSQAQSQQQAAQTQANAQIQMTQISAQTSLDLANKSAQSAREQAAISQDIAQKQMDSKRELLNVNLNALAQQRQEVRDAEREQTALQTEFNNQRIALAQKQLDENVRVAQTALNAQLIQQGLATGLTTAQQDPNRLTVTSLTANAGSTTGATTGSASTLGSSLAATAPTTPAAVGLVASPRRLGLVNQSLSANSAPASSNPLLASALGTPVEKMEKQAGVKTERAVPKAALALAANIPTKGKKILGTARGSYAHGLAAVAGGSFPAERQLVANSADSDLQKFRAEVVTAENESSFAEWRTRQFEAAASTATVHRDTAGLGLGHRK